MVFFIPVIEAVFRRSKFSVSGGGQYLFSVSKITPGGGDSCLYVSTWNGSTFVLDNNLLPASESSGGTDVTD